MRWIVRICILWLLASAAPALAQSRVALVVGESAYRTVSPLANPGADARLVADTLARAGFDVRLGLDLDKAALEAALDDFARDAQTADVAAVYFAGHGLESGGRNWLIPVDAAIRAAGDVTGAAVPFEAVARSLVGAKVKLVALDACRDNPFAARVAEGGAINRGLSEVELDGYVVIYAAGVGAVALDGQGNSPFAQSFARWVGEPNVDLRLLAGRIRDDVIATTTGRQRPFVSASLPGDVTVLAPGAPGTVRGAATVRRRPSAYFEYVRTVRPDDCVQTVEVKCLTRQATLAESRLVTFEDDGRMRVWSIDGAARQRTETPQDYKERAFALGGGAVAFSGAELDMIGVNTELETIALATGRRAQGVVSHWSDEPSLELVTRAPQMAVYSYDGDCRLGFVDLRTYKVVGEAVWAIPLACGEGKVEWIFDDEKSDRVLASVSTLYQGATRREVLLMTAGAGRLDCRIPGAAADAAFDGQGRVHVGGADGAIVAYDRQCHALSTHRLHQALVQQMFPVNADAMLSRSVDGAVKVWAADSGQVQRELTGLPRGARILTVASAGPALILNEDRRIYVWTDEPRLGAYVGPSAPVCGAQISPDANMLYALKCDGELEVWRRRTN